MVRYYLSSWLLTAAIQVMPSPPYRDRLRTSVYNVRDEVIVTVVLAERMKAGPVMEHKTRYSDSSMYDIVCTICGGTDGAGDDRLDHPCQGNERAGEIAAASRKVKVAEKALQEAVNRLKALTGL